ncbi:uncharacterized protein TRIADDRAFT_56865 [Trichoplax adhaerens]|uniref:RRM domain-containing protein n=1 Tax=Trichoplax adhaerens TaxID=10228 RepID=B3RWT0_TRIAD|nr:hypothetical protein TRIADDRAFT_56865 [Trichoplax adhaerens]EDV24755.1 hypothetical protein TRIADDRAFT_56865 [Trichoplax adhaerens]|eukprot:XP_002112645.1 hypothetical protein TRIADDRAFT_56865 [Trichoplax adhaerens]
MASSINSSGHYRCRLFVGNLADCDENEVRQLFQQYGQVLECSASKEKSYAFVKMDTTENANRAKLELDGKKVKNRLLRVRFASSNSTIVVSNLNQYVTNELLRQGFEKFGKIHRAVVIVDMRGKSSGRGLVEFSHKKESMAAIKECTENALLLTRSMRPVTVRSLEAEDDEDGLPERVVRNNAAYQKEWSVSPRIVKRNSREWEFIQRWKDLDKDLKEQRQAVDTKMKTMEQQLEQEIDEILAKESYELQQQQKLREEQLQQQMQQRFVPPHPGMRMGHPPEMPLMPKPDMYHGGGSPIMRGRVPPARMPFRSEHEEMPNQPMMADMWNSGAPMMDQRVPPHPYPDHQQNIVGSRQSSRDNTPRDDRKREASGFSKGPAANAYDYYPNNEHDPMFNPKRFRRM